MGFVDLTAVTIPVNPETLDVAKKGNIHTLLVYFINKLFQ